MCIFDLWSKLVPDGWREVNGHEESVLKATIDMAAAEPSNIKIILNQWLAKHQPCLFGRMAARLGLISYCVLTEEDLAKGDSTVRDILQDARAEWTREAFEGRKSGFVILLYSPRFARAEPDATVLEIAKSVGELYLLSEVDCDRVHLDEVFLEVPSRNRRTWRWYAGVNYFSAHGDGRWWHDHRIPGGMAFSTNSVGHMVKSGMLAQALSVLHQSIGVTEEEFGAESLDSLDKAHVIAMQTIKNAQVTPWGPATWLVNSDKETASSEHCDLPLKLQGFSPLRYEGFYHTDHTLPRLYFEKFVDRQPKTPAMSLDFTYLTDSSLWNVDFLTMGSGVQIRGTDGANERADQSSWRSRIHEVELDLSECPRLVEAISKKKAAPH